MTSEAGKLSGTELKFYASPPFTTMRVVLRVKSNGAALTEHLDLRGGRSCWQAEMARFEPSDPIPREIVDVAIVGAGIMGAMLAERLSADGRRVALLDRRAPSHGSTGASTALVMWAADTPLTELARTIGSHAAAQRWRRVAQAVSSLDTRIKALGLSCGWRSRPELYLAGDVLDPTDLKQEAEARRAAGLRSVFLNAEEVASRYGIAPRPALLSEDCFEVDPVALTNGLLSAARARGVSVSYPADVIAIEERDDHVLLTTADGRALSARQVVLATGYEAARDYLPEAFSLSSSFAIATAPGLAPLWGDNALIWEAADPYLYCRTTTDGRVIVGGGDEEFVDPVRRDAMIPDKRRALEAAASRLIGGEKIVADCAWAATFGSSPDGHPAIGRAKGQQRLWIAQGFGGNGVTFASLGASLIEAELAGVPDPGGAGFSPYRFA